MLLIALHWMVSALALLITAYVVPGFKVKSFGVALIACLLIGLVTPILLFLTLPLNILTLGLFTFVVYAIALKMCAAVLKDFTLTGWVPALIAGGILAFVNFGLHYLLV
jgi:putative membrane protein